MSTELNEVVSSGFFSQLGAFANYVLTASLFAIAGTVISQFLKKFFTLNANKAFILAAVIAAALGTLTSYSIDKFNFEASFEATTLIFALSTTCYQFVFSKDRLFKFSI